jgi:hypothetical protein
VLAAVAEPTAAGREAAGEDGVPGPDPALDGGGGVAVRGTELPGAGETAEIGRVQPAVGTGA